VYGKKDRTPDGVEDIPADKEAEFNQCTTRSTQGAPRHAGLPDGARYEAVKAPSTRRLRVESPPFRSPLQRCRQSHAWTKRCSRVMYLVHRTCKHDHRSAAPSVEERHGAVLPMDEWTCAEVDAELTLVQTITCPYREGARDPRSPIAPYGTRLSHPVRVEHPSVGERACLPSATLPVTRRSPHIEHARGHPEIYVKTSSLFIPSPTGEVGEGGREGVAS